MATGRPPSQPVPPAQVSWQSLALLLHVLRPPAGKKIPTYFWPIFSHLSLPGRHRSTGMTTPLPAQIFLRKVLAQAHGSWSKNPSKGATVGTLTPKCFPTTCSSSLTSLSPLIPLTSTNILLSFPCPRLPPAANTPFSHPLSLSISKQKLIHNTRHVDSPASGVRGGFTGLSVSSLMKNQLRYGVHML